MTPWPVFLTSSLGKKDAALMSEVGVAPLARGALMAEGSLIVERLTSSLGKEEDATLVVEDDVAPMVGGALLLEGSLILENLSLISEIIIDK